ncbi:MAG: YckD family protein [Bacillota bacterium]
MSRKLIIVVVTLLLLAMAIPSAYAAINDQQKADLQNLYKKMIEVRKQMIDVYIAAGQITPEQGKIMKDNMDQAQKYYDENGVTPGIGNGCGGGGGGAGMMGGGAGMMGGDAGLYGNSNGVNSGAGNRYGMMGRRYTNNL